MKLLPRNGSYIYRQEGNYSDPTEVSQEPGATILELTAPTTKEIWVKSLSLNPTQNATVYGQCKLFVGDADFGPAFTPLTMQTDNYDYDLIIRQNKSFRVALWSTAQLQSVGMQAEIMGMVYPDGTFDKYSKREWEVV